MLIKFREEDVLPINFGKEEHSVMLSGRLQYDLLTGEIDKENMEVSLLLNRPLAVSEELMSTVEMEVNLMLKDRIIELLSCCPSSVYEVLKDEFEVRYLLPKTTEILLKGNEAVIKPLTKIEKAMIVLKQNGFFVFEENEKLFMKVFSKKHSVSIQLSEEEIEFRSKQYDETYNKEKEQK